MNVNSIVFQYAAIGDYLFLILIVIASIIQAITQNKKKKELQEAARKKNMQTDTSVPEVLETRSETMKGYEAPVHNIFDSIEQFLVPEVEDEKYDWEDDLAEAKTAEENREEVFESTHQQELKLNSEIAAQNTLPISQKPVSDIAAVRYKSRIRDGFTLRKAVVYSEILNRKYT
ncbi:MAG: hypothetical protein GZ094_07450 [Mariniphaga sp.]|nr:hypothetical protein [Mariniphaga sp.]